MHKITKRPILLLVFIILLAGFLRFWQLTTVPPSLYWDEISQGFNAYSILMTGKDEHQEFLPLARFKAFGDYKAPVNIYLTVPAMAIFGKTDFAIRFVSAFLGTLTVVVAFALGRELFWKQPKRDLIALVTAFFLAISPWHIQLSRAAYEGNVATFFTVTGIFLFFFALRKQAWYLTISAVSFVIGLYAFNAHRVFIPLLLITLALLFYKTLFKHKKQVVVAGIVACIVLLPLLQFFSTPESKLRFNEVNIFSDLKTIETSNMLIAQDHNSFLSHLLHNRRVLYAREYLINYFDFFHPSYLFFKGDVNPRFSHQGNGELYLWMLPLLLLGFYFLLTERSKPGIFILIWFALAPVAAATARETPHALRSETFIPTYELIAAAGVVYGLSFIERYKQVKRYATPAVFVGLGLISAFSILQFWHDYTVHNPRLYSQDWQYGYKETVAAVEAVKDRYDEIYFTDAYGRPSMYVAWYGDLSPEQYWRTAVVHRDPYGFYNVTALGKYHFVSNVPETVDPARRVLYVMTPETVPSDAKVLKKIQFLSGADAFVIAEP